MHAMQTHPPGLLVSKPKKITQRNLCPGIESSQGNLVAPPNLIDEGLEDTCGRLLANFTGFALATSPRYAHPGIFAHDRSAQLPARRTSADSIFPHDPSHIEEKPVIIGNAVHLRSPRGWSASTSTASAFEQRCSHGRCDDFFALHAEKICST